MQIQIEHQCPQCGAPAVLEESDRLFTCGFCRVKSYLLTSQVFRYFIPPKNPSDESLVFFPYWRFKGLFFIHSETFTNRFIDISSQAIKSEWFPENLGLRSQALKIRFVSSETKGRFLFPDRAVKKVMDEFKENLVAPLPKPVLHTEFIGESLSLIYAPFYLREKVYDGVLDQPVSGDLPPDFDPENLSAEPPEPDLKFIPCLCPNCSWDLSGARDSLTLVCKNCNRLWMSGESRLKNLPFAHLPSESKSDIHYLPFWRIRADVEGIDLSSQGDLVKCANLPKVLPPETAKTPLYFWSVAFKIRPQALLRINRQLTLSQPSGELEEEIPKARLHPINLPIIEAFETLKSTLSTLMVPKNFMMTHLPGIRITGRKFKLIYLPFEDGHHDIYNDMFKIGIQKSMLTHSRNL